MINNKYIGIIGSRKLPPFYKNKIKEVIRQLLNKGYGIASGGAVGADSYALEALLELGVAKRGIIFSAWQTLDQFPFSVKDQISQFISLDGRIVWGTVPPLAPQCTVVSGLLSRNVQLVSGAAGLVAFLHGESRGTGFTIKQGIKRAVPVVAFVSGVSSTFPQLEAGVWQPLNTKGCWQNGFRFRALEKQK